jgi:hypothetical protein
MTEELARRCAHAIHLITPDDVIFCAGRASLHILDAVGWHRFAATFSRRPLIWLVEVGYRVVAGHRGLFSRLVFRTR